MLLQAQVPERQGRTFLGHLRKVAKGKGGDRAVVDALNRCAAAQAMDPVTFLQACFKAPSGGLQAGLDELDADMRQRLGLSATPETIDG